MPVEGILGSTAWLRRGFLGLRLYGSAEPEEGVLGIDLRASPIEPRARQAGPGYGVLIKMPRSKNNMI